MHLERRDSNIYLIIPADESIPRRKDSFDTRILFTPAHLHYLNMETPKFQKEVQEYDENLAKLGEKLKEI